jgi:hypothetical protein
LTAFVASALVVAALAAVGAALDRALGLGMAALGSWRWALGALVALTLVALGWLHPLLGAVLLGLVAAAGRLAASEAVLPPARRLAPFAALVLLVGALRPMHPLYWDEHVWLTKTRLATRGLHALADAALAPSSPVLPRGYPIGWSLAEAVLAAGVPDTAALSTGAFALSALCLALYVALLARGGRGPVALGVMAAAPIAWVHWRSAYVDLPLGLLSASVALGLEQARRYQDARTMPVVVAAAALAGAAKDEGAVHIAAIVLAFAFTDVLRDPAQRRGLALTAAAGLAPGVTWWLLRHAAGVANSDHAPTGFALSAVGPLVRQGLWHLADVQSWGIVPAVVLAALPSTLRRRATRALPLALLCVGGALAAAVLVGPERVRVFAQQGTLLSRLALQLLPLGAVVFDDALRPEARLGATADAR